EHHDVRDHQRRHSIRRNVPGRTQRRAGDVEAYPLSKRVQQVDEPLNVKDPYNEYGIACTGAQRCNRDQRQHRRDEISVSDLIGKRPRHSGANDGADKQRHAQDAGGVVQQQWLQRRTQRHGRKARRNIPPRDKNIHKKTSHELQTEDLEVPHSNPPFQTAINRFRAASQSIGIRVVPPLSFSRSFVFLWFVAFLAYFSFQLTTGSLPLFALALGADDAAIGLLTGIIALASLVSRPWVGWWLDRGVARWGMLAAGATGLDFTLIRRIPHASRRGPNRLIHPAVFVPGTVLVAAMATFGLNFALLAIHASRRGLANPGWVFAAFAVGQVVMQTVLRRVSDRFGRHAAIGPGLALIALGTWVTAAVPGGWLLLGGFLTGAW